MFREKLGVVAEKRRLSQRLYDRFVRKYYSHDLDFELQLHARRESARYVRRHMASAVMFRSRWQLLESAVSEARSGLYLEFGVEKGRSANFIGRLVAESGSKIHAFDSFEGLPEAWSGTFEKRGKFSLNGGLPAVLPNVTLHKGWFSETLPGFLGQTDLPVAFLHVDCDIYSSTKTIFDLLGDRLRAGTIIAFDEYFNYHNWQQHEFKAWQEFVADQGIAYHYRGFAARGGQVYLKLL